MCVDVHKEAEVLVVLPSLFTHVVWKSNVYSTLKDNNAISWFIRAVLIVCYTE